MVSRTNADIAGSIAFLHFVTFSLAYGAPSTTVAFYCKFCINGQP
jgi:hypothetical protein